MGDVKVSYVVVPRMEYVILRVAGDHPSKKRLVEDVRSGRVSGQRVRSDAVLLWSKARVKREVLKA